MKVPGRLLLGPGPSPVSQRVMDALASPVLSHLDPHLLQVMDELRAMLERTFLAERALRDNRSDIVAVVHAEIDQFTRDDEWREVDRVRGWQPPAFVHDHCGSGMVREHAAEHSSQCLA